MKTVLNINTKYTKKQLKLRFSSANGAGLFYQTPLPLPYLDAHYSTRSTTNAICLPR